MAKTFYGYAERDAESYVDWSQIGSDISEMLNEEISRRVTLKTDLDKASREYGETLANAPTGEHKGATDFVTDLSSNAMQARLVQDRLLKSGQLKVKDYLLMRENLKSGTQQVFDVAKKFQEEFSRKTERMTKEESSKFEQYLFKLTEGFSNFNNSGAYINPTNYQVSLAKKKRVDVGDGKHVYHMSKDPQDFFTVNELNNFVTTDVDVFNVSGALDKLATKAGDRLQTITYYDSGKDGYVELSIADVTGDVYDKNLTDDQKRLVDKYREAEKLEIQNLTSNAYNATSILTDYIGKASNGKDFRFVWSAEEAAKHEEAILLEKDPDSGFAVPKISEKQEEYMADELSKALKFRLKQAYSEKFTQRRQYTSGLDKTGNRKINRTKNMVSGSVFLSDLLYGNDRQKSDALNALKGYNRKNVIQYRFQKDARTGTVDLVVDVPSDKKQKGFETQVLVSDFNNNANDVARVVRGLFFDDITNILDQEAKSLYESSMSDVILDNYGDYKYNGKPLTRRQIVPVQEVDKTQSDRTRSPIIPAAQRQVAEPGVGTVMSAPDLYREMKDSRDLRSGSDFATSISMSFTQTPAGERDDVVPLSNMKVEPLTSSKIFKDYGIVETYEAVRLSDPSLFTRPILIPAWDTMYDSAEAAMIYLDTEAAKIERGERTNRIDPSELTKFFTYNRTFGKNDSQWFDIYNPVPADSGQTSEMGQTSDKGDDPAGEDEPGAADDTNANPGNDLWKKKKPVTNPSQPQTQSKPVLQPLKVNIGDGKDYQRRMLNFENTRGSSSGGGVNNYGFTGADMKSKFDKESGTKEEKALKVIDKHIIGQNKSTFESILYDLGIDRSTFDAFPEVVQEQLVDWKFNTGRSVADLVYIASDMDSNYTGFVAHRAKAKTPSEISSIDISKLTKSALSKARKELYEGRIKSMEDMLARGSKKVTKADINFAKQGYNNSQKYRLQ